MEKGRFPHVYFLPLDGEGKVATECAVMKKDPLDNIYFISLKSLDTVDKQRIFDIIHDRNANNFELWDLMSTKTLGNGVNALTYFHQFVKCLTSQGKILTVKKGQIGLQAPTTTTTAEPVAAAE